MCSCTHEDPYRCSARLNRSRCTCSCHKHYRVQQQPVVEPPDPLEEKDAEIARLHARIAVLEQAARTYLINSTPVNAVALDKALKQVKGERDV